VVSNDDALRWLEELLEEPSENIAAKLAELEPSVAGTAIRMASRARQTVLA
jgi:hypothetical protein